MKNKKTYYYKTFNDDFFDDGVKHTLPDGYKWVRKGLLFKILSHIVYVFALIFSGIYCKLFLHIKFIGADKLRKQKGGFFLYGNHTQPVGDVFIPAFACFPKRIYTVVSSANLDLPVIGKILPCLGALPIPENISGMKQFQNAIEFRIKTGHPVIIYPEAHVWKYYTGIRPFGAVSFKYPVNLDVPVYAMTTTYKKRKFFKKPKTEIYIDGPFYADGTKKEKAENLRKSVCDCMTERSQLSNCEYIKYEKSE